MRRACWNVTGLSEWDGVLASRVVQVQRGCGDSSLLLNSPSQDTHPDPRCRGRRGQYLKQLVRAFCPQIYGNAVVKAGILLALFGGSRKQLSSGAPGSGSAGDADDAVPLRGNVHVLLVGDPGLGKSQARGTRGCGVMSTHGVPWTARCVWRCTVTACTEDGLKGSRCGKVR